MAKKKSAKASKKPAPAPAGGKRPAVRSSVDAASSAAAKIVKTAQSAGQLGGAGGVNAMAAWAAAANLETAKAAGPRYVAPMTPLPDVAVASFGEPAAAFESVIGTDERVRIETTADYPWRAIASLLITARDNTQYFGTGWFVSPRTLVTAGHCVFIHSPHVPQRHGWVKSISVMPGRNADALPFDAATSTEFKSVDGWTESGDPNFDYAAIILPVPLGDRVGTFGFGKFRDDELAAMNVTVAGYPADQDVGTLWSDRRAVASVGPTKVYYDLDTAGGQSGAPVWTLDANSQPVAVAVHAYGTGGGTRSNSGTRITEAAYDVIRSWIV